jgi:hypothetical protein
MNKIFLEILISILSFVFLCNYVFCADYVTRDDLRLLYMKISRLILQENDIFNLLKDANADLLALWRGISMSDNSSLISLQIENGIVCNHFSYNGGVYLLNNTSNLVTGGLRSIPHALARVGKRARHF